MNFETQSGCRGKFWGQSAWIQGNVWIWRAARGHRRNLAGRAKTKRFQNVDRTDGGGTPLGGRESKGARIGDGPKRQFWQTRGTAQFEARAQQAAAGRPGGSGAKSPGQRGPIATKNQAIQRPKTHPAVGATLRVPP